MTTTIAPAQSHVRVDGLLRAVLLADGIACIALGAVVLPLTGWLATTMGVPTALIVGLAAYLIAYGVGETYVGTKRTAPRGAVVAVILLNVMWVLDSAIVLATGWFSPTTTGTVVFAVGAIGVLGVTLLQTFAYRKA